MTKPNESKNREAGAVDEGQSGVAAADVSLRIQMVTTSTWGSQAALAWDAAFDDPNPATLKRACDMTRQYMAHATVTHDLMMARLMAEERSADVTAPPPAAPQKRRWWLLWLA
jgi:hypothetical protein